MFDGKTFLPVTGTPMRKMACISRPLADADPVPFGVAILKAKSLVRSMDSCQLPASRFPRSEPACGSCDRLLSSNACSSACRCALHPILTSRFVVSGKRVAGSGQRLLDRHERNDRLVGVGY